MITKEKLKYHIEKFPEEMDSDELIDRLMFVEKLEERIVLSKKKTSEKSFKEIIGSYTKL